MSFTILNNIISKTRRLTGTGNSFQLTDQLIQDYVNSFYLYDLPSQFRSLKLKDKYTFNTVQGQDVYPFDSEHYTTVEMPCYIAKREMKLFQDPWSFYGVNFNWQNQENFATGDGTTGTLTGTITNITQAANAVVTSAGHDLVTGRIVTITGVVGMTEVNNLSFTITVINANDFALNVDSTGFTPYGSGGTWLSSAYSGITQAVPLIPSINNDPGPITSPNVTYPMSRVQNILITANTTSGKGFVPNTPGSVNVTDDGLGNLIEILQNATPTGSDQFNQTFYSVVVGTINYQTGQIVFTAPLSQSIAAGNPIQIQYNPVTLSIPLSILFFQNQFTLRPVPDKGYTVELVAYRQPTQVLNQPLPQSGINHAELNEWWELLSAGAAKKIFEDRDDEMGVQKMDKMLQERYGIAETRTYAQIGKQNSSTLFRDQLQYNYGSGSFTFGGGGST